MGHPSPPPFPPRRLLSRACCKLGNSLSPPPPPRPPPSPCLTPKGLQGALLRKLRHRELLSQGHTDQEKQSGGTALLPTPTPPPPGPP